MSPKISPDDNQDFPPDSMVTGSWNYSQVTVHVHGQEVLSEETVHPGVEPESPTELQDPVQTSTPEESHEEMTQSPDLEPPEEQSPCHELEFQPLQESGEKPQQEGGWWQSMGRGIFLLYQEGWVDCNGNKLQNPGS